MDRDDPEIQQEEEPDRPADTGMIGRDDQPVGPGRDTRLTEGDPAAASTEHTTSPVGMSGADPQRTRLGDQETTTRPASADEPKDDEEDDGA